MVTTLELAVNDVLDRLGDSANDIWTRDEIALYYQDGYDQFCRRARCLFDFVVIPNTPRIGNWQTVFEKYLMLARPRSVISDEPANMPLAS